MSLSSCKDFTYGSDPANSPTDAVRYYTGDTIRESALLDDKEIAFSLSNNPDPKRAAAECLDTLAARFAREGSIKVGDISKDLKDVSEKFRKRAQELRSQSNKSVLPFLGGLTVSGKDALRSDSDAVQPAFEVGDWDNPNAVQVNGSNDPLLGGG
ncbi:MAG: hypothetical protein KAV87_67860 [Desulfobacteraceae bacterium]|nr:hypothetical protein [Desulfobacteraceae bacterium]